MPIYEYRCELCGRVSEHLMGVGEGEPIRCRHCGSEKVIRILSAASYTLRASHSVPGHTCCGREERCDTPPCSGGGGCRRE